MHALQQYSAALVFLSASSLGFATTLEFKGIQIGGLSSRENIEAALLTTCDTADRACTAFSQEMLSKYAVKCGNSAVLGGSVCNGKTTIAGVAADANIVLSPEGRVIRMNLTFNSAFFHSVHGSLLEKMGKPTSSRENDVQNGFGARFAQTESEWKGDNDTYLVASKYWGTIKKSAVRFGTLEDDSAVRTRFINTKDL